MKRGTKPLFNNPHLITTKLTLTLAYSPWLGATGSCIEARIYFITVLLLRKYRKWGLVRSKQDYRIERGTKPLFQQSSFNHHKVNFNPCLFTVAGRNRLMHRGKDLFHHCLAINTISKKGVGPVKVGLSYREGDQTPF